MKKLLTLLVLLFSLQSLGLAAPNEDQKPIELLNDLNTNKKTVGIFLEAPLTYVKNETVRKIVPEKVVTKLPKTYFTILPYDDTEMAVRTYREDNRMIVNQYYSKPLNRADIINIAKEVKCDYALFIKIETGFPRARIGLFARSFETTVTCDVRLLNISTGKYVLSKQIVKDGTSTSIVLGVPSFDHAYTEALTKALDELVLDDKIITAELNTEIK